MINLAMPDIKRLEVIAQNSKDCISFSQGALRIGVDQSIKEYVQQILHTDKADYYTEAAGIFKLREKLAQSLSERWNCAVGPEHVLISHGATGSLSSLCSTLLDEGDQVLLLEPSYPVYNSILKICKAQPIFAPAFSMKKNMAGQTEWVFDFNCVEQALTDQTKMIIFSNPSNPNGMFLGVQDLMRLKELCEKNRIYLIVDEVYEDFIFEGTFSSVTPWTLNSDFVMRVGSFSKSFAMSGWRIGYIVGSSRLISAITNVQSCTLGCPNALGQYGALYALEHEQDIVPGLQEKVLKSKEIACAFFDELQERNLISYVQPKASFYIFFQPLDTDGMSFVMDVLKTVKISMVPGTDFGPGFGNFVRFCFAREPIVVTEGIKRFQKYFILKHQEKNKSIEQGVL
ncbi:MAG: pyridoxal phosphate-dependent aminotransferase [bacterium]